MARYVHCGGPGARQTAHLCKGYLLQLFSGEQEVGCSQHSLGHAAGYPEDHAGTGSKAERHIQRVFLKLCEVNAGLFDHMRDLLGGQYQVHITHAVVAELRPRRLELLGGTRHHGDHVHILGINIQLLGVVALGYRAEHLLRRSATRQIREHVRIILLRILHPCRAAGRELRQLRARPQPIDKLGGLFHDGKIRCEAGIEHLIDTDHTQSRDQFAERDFTRFKTERVTYGYAYSRRYLYDNRLRIIVDGRPGLIDLGLHRKSPGGTYRSALATVYAFHISNVSTECRGDHH